MARTPKNPARTRVRPPKGGVSKTDFVNALPADMAAADVIAKAKDAGIELSTNYVYLIRSKAKRGASGSRRTRARASVEAAAHPAVGRRGGIEQQFTNLVAEIGLSRAEELLRAVRAKFTGA